MRTTILDSAIRRVFGVRAPTVVDALLRSEPLTDLVDGLEAAEVSRRAEMVSRLQALPAKHERRCADAHAKVAAARLALEAAHAAAKKASQDLAESMAESLSLAHRRDAERGALERELLDTADPAISEFISNCERLFQVARNREPLMVLQPPGVRPSLLPDSSRVNRACEALRAAMEAAREMRMQALTRAQVQERLAALRQDLIAPLKAVDLGPAEFDVPSTVH